MTTVAYRDGVMAADTQGDWSGIRTRVPNKIVRVGNALIGVAGNFTDCRDFIDWYAAGADRKALPEFRTYGVENSVAIEALVAAPDGLTIWTEHFQPDPVAGEFWAVGSGAKAAIAAMYMGADAAEAVRIAALVDVKTGGDVQMERLEDKKKGRTIKSHKRNGRVLRATVRRAVSKVLRNPASSKRAKMAAGSALTQHTRG